MTTRLTFDQEAVARRAVEAGLSPSVEAFISAAVQALDHELHVTAEDFLGMPTEEIRQAIQEGLNSGDAQPWEGASRFKARMIEKHRRRLDGRDP